MAEISNEVRDGHVWHIVTLHNGERIKLCRCHQSKEYPLCDSTHKLLGNTIGPVVVEASDPTKQN